MNLTTIQTIDDIDVLFFVSTIQPSVFSKIEIHELSPGKPDRVYMKATIDLDHTDKHKIIFKSEIFDAFKDGNGQHWLDLNANRTIPHLVDTESVYRSHIFTDESFQDFLKAACWLPF